MGRPLYSSLLLSAKGAELCATQSDPSKTTSMSPKTEYPVVEKWSRTNAFDPDSDEFFNEESAVYEAFLSAEDVAARAMAEQTQRMRSLSERLLRPGERDPDARITTLFDEQNSPSTDADFNHVVQRGASGLDIYFVDRLVGEIRHGGTLPEPPSTQGDAPVSDVAAPLSTARDHEVIFSRSHPMDLVSGLRHLSESPRPLDPVEFPSRSISPIPEMPARISGVFPTVPRRRRTFTVAPVSGSSSTSRLQSESPTRLEFVVPGVGHNVSVPASLTS
jgi:hypothetical protein